MRRLIVFFMLITFLSSYSFAQSFGLKVVDAAKEKVEKVAKDKKEKVGKKAEEVKSGVNAKKDGAPDMILNKNKGKAKKTTPVKKEFDEVN